MKIILTEDQYKQLTEMIKLNIKVGDTIMGGKFKNKKVVVKTIGKNDKGDITINGKPLLRFRILKENNEANNIPSALRRRINLFDHELNTTLRESDPCEYARFNQYKRGIINYEDARSFFRPDLNKLHDPFLMQDMAVAVFRINQAITSGEKILIYGDYDVDGTTSVALTFSFFKKLYFFGLIKFRFKVC